YRSTFGGKVVRVVEAEITVTTTAGTATGVYRLITTLLDHRRYPADALIRLYHERWEIETAYLELKSSILGGRVLRARTPTGVHAPTPAPSNERYPNTTPEARTLTDVPTRPPSTSTSSPDRR